MDNSKKLQNLLGNIGLYIDDELKKKLCFQENLIVSKFVNGCNFPNPVGGLSVSIQPAQDDKYLVCVNSKFKLESSTGGSTITAWVSPNLNTIEEKRTEYISGAMNLKQSLYLGSQSDHILVRHGPAQGGERVKKVYPYEAVGDLVGEGANLILIRLLALVKYVGEIEVSTMYITGDLCRNIYTCTGPELGIVNNAELQICKIRRKIIEQSGVEHYCHATLTTNGRFVNQQWHDCTYTVHVNPLLDLSEPNANFFNTPPLANNWREDFELFSTFLDQKVLNTKLSECYLHDSPGLEDLLKDYIQHLLVHKPEKDVIEFTTEYFKRYAKSVKKPNLEHPNE